MPGPEPLDGDTRRGAPDSAERLERALDLFVGHCEAGRDPAELLHAHADLRDLLEPLLEGAGAAPAAAPAAGGDGAAERVLGDFRLVRELGRGGMGIVYEAWQRTLDRRVALKVLAPALAASPGAVARFRREASAMARLRHPNVVEVYGFGAEGEQHWFAMELVVGAPLHRCAAQFAPPTAAVALVAQVLEALVHAHGQGLVHRDVKPGNVLVRNDGSAVLTDFGLAQLSELPSVTADGAFLGTLDYAAPEQVRGEAVDARADVWSVGVVLAELLTGKRPFARPSSVATLRAILTEEPPSLRRHGVADRDLAAILAKALHKEPARRYGAAAEFLADLRAWQVGGLVRARAPGFGERALRWARREPWRATAVLVVLLAAPVVTWSVAHAAQNAERLAVAARAEQAAEREAALGEAWFAYAEEAAPRGLAALARLPEDPTDLEVAVVRALLLVRDGQREAAETVLRPFAAQRAGALALAMLAAAPPDDRELLEASATSAIEAFVLGNAAYARAIAGVLPEPHFRAACRHFGTAVAMAGEVRAPFLFWWMVAAARAADGGAFAAAFAAYQGAMPQSRGLQVAAVVCASTIPVARGLELLQGVDFTESPKAQLALALLQLRAGKLAESERAYRAGLAADPGNARAWSQFADVLFQQQRYKDALAAGRQWVAVQPNDGAAWNRVGTSALLADQPREAREAFAKAAELDPRSYSARQNLGLVLADAGETEAALQSFAVAAKLAPNEAAPWQHTARALRRLGRRQESAVAEIRALQADSSNWKQWLAVAVALADGGWHDAALPYCERAVELAPQQARPHWQLSAILLDQPQPDAARALAAAQRAFELCQGKEPRAVWGLAVAEVANGLRQAAIGHLEQLLALDQGVSAELRERAAAQLETLRAGR
ncbi:MAG: protein kinase [Planctomycetes bacterium]|nr:protein kinase [Planctomycetota bacterium]